MRWFWHFNGRVTDGRRWLVRALDSPDTVDAGSERAVALVSAGHLAWVQGDYHAARRWLSEGVALARERSDRSALADGLLHLALLVGHEQAQPAGYEEESLAISRDLDDPWLAAPALHAVGVGALTRSDGASAHRRLNESLALWLELGDAWFAAHALNALGDLARAESDVATAAERYSRCLELLHQHGIRHSSASVLHNLGYVRHQLGDDRAAQPLFREALALFVNQGDHRGIAECLVGLGVCLLGMAPRATPRSSSAQPTVSLRRSE